MRQARQLEAYIRYAAQYNTDKLKAILDAKLEAQLGDAL